MAVSTTHSPHSTYIFRLRTIYLISIFLLWTDIHTDKNISGSEWRGFNGGGDSWKVLISCDRQADIILWSEDFCYPQEFRGEFLKSTHFLHSREASTDPTEEVLIFMTDNSLGGVGSNWPGWGRAHFFPLKWHSFFVKDISVGGNSWKLLIFSTHGEPQLREAHFWNMLFLNGHCPIDRHHCPSPHSPHPQLAAQ